MNPYLTTDGSYRTLLRPFRKLRAFCRVLRGAKWRKEYGQLRTRIDGGSALMKCCPITYVYYVATGDFVLMSRYHDAGEAIGFEGVEIEQIAAAADSDFETAERAKLRRILERACGVRKEKS